MSRLAGPSLLIAAALAVSAPATWPMQQVAAWHWATGAVVVAALALTGSSLLSRDRRTAHWLLSAAACWALGAFPGPSRGAAPLPSAIVPDLAWAGMWLSLFAATASASGSHTSLTRLRETGAGGPREPAAAPTAPRRGAVGTADVASPSQRTAWSARPGPRSARWWLTVQGSLAVSAAVAVAVVVVVPGLTMHGPGWWAVLSVVLATGGLDMIVIAGRIRRLQAVRRAVVQPVAVTAVLACVSSWALVLWAGDTRRVDSPPVWWLQCLLIAAVPAAVAVAAVRRRVARVAAAGLLACVTSPPSVDGVQRVLRQVLRDPTATVLYRLPGADEFVRADGSPAAVPCWPARLVVRVVEDGEGDAAVDGALVHLDPALRDDPMRVEAAVVSCGPALAYARLQVANEVRLQQVERSRARVVAMALDERRRLERNLHDGAQQSLLAVSARLSAARAGVDDPGSLTVLDAARHELRTALTDLRVLTRDLNPVVLASEGLAAALEVAVDERSWDASVQASGERFGSDVEIIAYLTVIDLLAGLSRRRCGAPPHVTVIRRDQTLLVTVEHDTRRGDDEPDWVTVVADRLGSVSGELRDRTGGPGGRAAFEAMIPCG